MNNKNTKSDFPISIEVELCLYCGPPKYANGKPFLELEIFVNILYRSNKNEMGRSKKICNRHTQFKPVAKLSTNIHITHAMTHFAFFYVVC